MAACAALVGLNIDYCMIIISSKYSQHISPISFITLS
ncbi:hypothetical protein Q604_UNBC16342G0001, partial [human gut metagenome]